MEGQITKEHEKVCWGDDRFAILIAEMISQVYRKHIKT